jgi:hypothetical protein
LKTKLVMLLVAIAVLATGCRGELYSFVPVPLSVPPGSTNLLHNPSFEDPFHMCTVNCNAGSGWSMEHTTVGVPTFSTSTDGRVTGRLAETIRYTGHRGDDGKTAHLDRDVELYQGAAGGEATSGGHLLTLTLWVSGTCNACAPFIGIESFDKHNDWLGEEDQYFKVPATPRPVQVRWVVPEGTVIVAAYIQIPEIFEKTNFVIHVDNALLTSRTATAEELKAAAKHPHGNG